MVAGSKACRMQRCWIWFLDGEAVFRHPGPRSRSSRGSRGPNPGEARPPASTVSSTATRCGRRGRPCRTGPADEQSFESWRCAGWLRTTLESVTMRYRSTMSAIERLPAIEVFSDTPSTLVLVDLVVGRSRVDRARQDLLRPLLTSAEICSLRYRPGTADRSSGSDAGNEHIDLDPPVCSQISGPVVR